jgi:hypothetical protein
MIIKENNVRQVCTGFAKAVRHIIQLNKNKNKNPSVWFVLNKCAFLECLIIVVLRNAPSPLAILLIYNVCSGHDNGFSNRQNGLLANFFFGTKSFRSKSYPDLKLSRSSLEPRRSINAYLMKNDIITVLSTPYIYRTSYTWLTENRYDVLVVRTFQKWSVTIPWSWLTVTRFFTLYRNVVDHKKLSHNWYMSLYYVWEMGAGSFYVNYLLFLSIHECVSWRCPMNHSN